jgi:hypothetical protein
MQQAHEQGQTWKATDKALEKAAYASVEASIDQKRRFRDDAGELGYVGGSYTKKSAGDRFDQSANAKENSTIAGKSSKITYSFMDLPEETPKPR